MFEEDDSDRQVRYVNAYEGWGEVQRRTLALSASGQREFGRSPRHRCGIGLTENAVVHPRTAAGSL